MNGSKSAFVLRASDRIYQWLLWMLPTDFRREYGPSMALVFRDCCRAEVASNGYRGLASLWCRTILDLVGSSIREHLAQASIEMNRSSVWPIDSLIKVPLTPRARRSLEIAERTAGRNGDHLLGAEHVIIGLMEEGNGVAGQVLKRLSANATTTCRPEVSLAHSMPTSRHRSNFVQLLLQWAGAEAGALGHSYIGTEHLLLGLIKQDHAATRACLNSIEIPVAQVEVDILKIIAA